MTKMIELNNTRLNFPLEGSKFKDFLEKEKQVSVFTLNTWMVQDFLNTQGLSPNSIQVIKYYDGCLTPGRIEIKVDDFGRKEETFETISIVQKQDGFFHVESSDTYAHILHLPKFGKGVKGFTDVVNGRTLTLKEISDLYLHFQGVSNLEVDYETETRISEELKGDQREYRIIYNVYDPEYKG